MLDLFAGAGGGYHLTTRLDNAEKYAPLLHVAARTQQERDGA